MRDARVRAELDRAAELEANGALDDARDAYLAILAREPSQYDAMMCLGVLLARHGQPVPARTIFAQAAARYPHNALAHAFLANILVEMDEWSAAQDSYATALELDPACLEAHRGLAIVFERRGDEEAANAAWRRGFPDGSLVMREVPQPELRVLLVTSAIGGNIPLETILDERRYSIATLIAESFSPATVVPRVDVLVNAIGDPDRSARALHCAQRVVDATGLPTLNLPARVLASGRLENARRLADIPGAVIPHTELAPRAQVAQRARDIGYPVLLRSPGFHTGEHFTIVEEPDDLAAALALLPGADILLFAFVDTRGVDRRFRKYRVMWIGNVLYPMHLAISDHWKVHYFSAAMGEDAALRREERAFLDDMRAALGARAVAVLDAVRDRIGLDYGGIDFGLDTAGRVVIFEANATMVVMPPPTEPMWEYRRAAIERVIDAARALLREKAE